MNDRREDFSTIDHCHLIEIDIKAIAAEGLAFDRLELFAHCIVLVRRNDLVQCRKQDCIFAGFVRAIHPVEGDDMADEALTTILGFQSEVRRRSFA